MACRRSHRAPRNDAVRRGEDRRLLFRREVLDAPQQHGANRDEEEFGKANSAELNV